MYTKIYKVYGRDGHRQRASFEPSFANLKTWSGCDVSMINSDITHTNDYCYVIIDAPTIGECEAEFLAQLFDGIFENCHFGKIVEI